MSSAENNVTDLNINNKPLLTCIKSIYLSIVHECFTLIEITCSESLLDISSVFLNYMPEVSMVDS